MTSRQIPVVVIPRPGLQGAEKVRSGRFGLILRRFAKSKRPMFLGSTRDCRMVSQGLRPRIMYLSTPCGSGRTVLLYHAAMSRRVRLPQGLLTSRKRRTRTRTIGIRDEGKAIPDKDRGSHVALQHWWCWVVRTKGRQIPQRREDNGHKRVEVSRRERKRGTATHNPQGKQKKRLWRIQGLQKLHTRFGHAVSVLEPPWKATIEDSYAGARKVMLLSSLTSRGWSSWKPLRDACGQ